MLADVPRTFTTPEIRVDCPDAVKFDVVRAIAGRYAARGHEVIDVDGARILFDRGAPPTWGLVRASNTGPILVMRFEAATAERLANVRSEVEAAVDEERKKREV
jgi:phosphomannomutase/phosphoglucomutase